MTTGNIASWKKKEGDAIAAGDIIAEVETDKATMEWEAQDEGVLAKIVVPAGARDVPVGTPVAIVVDDASDVAAFANYEAGSAASLECCVLPRLLHLPRLLLPPPLQAPLPTSRRTP